MDKMMIFCKRDDCINYSQKDMPDWAGDNGDCRLNTISIDSCGCQCYKQNEKVKVIKETNV